MDNKELLENARMVHKVSGHLIERLEKELAEPEKPTLRRGDYGEAERDIGDTGFVVMEQSTLPGSPKAFYGDGAGQVNVNDCVQKHVRFGNIFDEIKALAEDVERFETTSPAALATTYWIDNVGDLLIDIKTNEKQTVVKAENIPAFILKLRQMESTHKRKEQNC